MGHQDGLGLAAPGDDLLRECGVTDSALVESALDAIAGQLLAGAERDGEGLMRVAPTIQRATADAEDLGEFERRRAIAAQALLVLRRTSTQLFRWHLW